MAGQNYCVVDGCLLSLSLCRRRFQDLLKVRPSSLFILCGCISSSIASLMSRSIYPVLVEMSFVSCSIWNQELSYCLVTKSQSLILLISQITIEHRSEWVLSNLFFTASVPNIHNHLISSQFYKWPVSQRFCHQNVLWLSCLCYLCCRCGQPSHYCPWPLLIIEFHISKYVVSSTPHTLVFLRS